MGADPIPAVGVHPGQAARLSQGYNLHTKLDIRHIKLLSDACL